MAYKVAALLVLCLVLVAAVELPKAAGDQFGSCFNTCEQQCKADGQGQTFCEMKCDTDCFDKEVAGKLHIKFP
ncbi:hypothetical protein NC652_025321 [Populus alba x Populus x berolinensis]|uniref:Major pollen allergen Ole e 6-like n=3 Tax=Populus TaxID=3689 RepID=A0A4U5Q684_POPAL|nr:hypothetical protein POTOM_035809 [Populus tomentosa]KAJ6898760.1 hypothetical protein NC652_025321 [Populus alba x Populus x berolinensis]KAJ6981691.1 hypothetical protein NC653_024941 [Populus alba x Populus x berolinensis]TKS03695.1 hypothetical protein D5086_0000149980 [Populus alba]